MIVVGCSFLADSAYPRRILDGLKKQGQSEAASTGATPPSSGLALLDKKPRPNKAVLPKAAPCSNLHAAE